MANTIAFQQYALKDFEGGWEAGFEAVKKMGIDTIEPWCGALPADADATVSLGSLRESLMAQCMKLSCGHLSVEEFENRYEEWRDLLLEYMSNHSDNAGQYR